MRKDSLVIFVTSIVLTLGIVGGAHYLYLQNLNNVPGEATVKSPSDIATGKPYHPPTQPAIRRTDTPIECKKSDGTVFYTNATRCKDVNLNNRLSYADPVKIRTRSGHPGPHPYSSTQQNGWQLARYRQKQAAAAQRSSIWLSIIFS
jgi:hypothetical protein